MLLGVDIDTAKIFTSIVQVALIESSQFILLFGFFLLYTDCVPFELLGSAALL
jgi:hypothetical protein